MTWNLRQYQENFWQSARDVAHSRRIVDQFCGSAQFSAFERLHLYHGMYYFRQKEALRDSFPKLCQHLGDERFTQLALRYIQQYPSTHPALEWLGQHFVQFCAQPECELTQEMIDLAALEWARCLSLIAAQDDLPISIHDINVTTFANCRYQFVYSLQLIWVKTAADKTWQQIAQGQDLANISLFVTDMTPIVTWRQKMCVYHQVIEYEHGQALQMAMAGQSMADICNIFKSHLQPEYMLTAIMASWFDKQWITNLYHSEEKT